MVIKNLDKISVYAHKILKPYLKKLLEIHKDNIKSIVLYGSGTSEDFVPKKSNINLIVICEKIDFDDLKKSVRIVTNGIKKGIIAPLFFTPKHIRTSQDVFPIEFLEFKDNYLVLYGDDPFTELHINEEHLRLECEEQIKGKLIRIRQAYLETSGKKGGIRNLLITSLNGIIPPIRAILRLSAKGRSASGGKDITPPRKKSLVLERAEELIGIDREVFTEMLSIKKGQKVSIHKLEDIFKRYLYEIEKIAVYVDRL